MQLQPQKEELKKENEENEENSENSEETIVQKKPNKKLVEKKKTNHSSEDEEEGPLPDTKTENKKTGCVITLTQILPNNEKLSHNFQSSFSINRKKNLDANICIKDKEISRDHAEIIFVQDYGFFLQDIGSRNHTYYGVKDNATIVLEENMEIVMGKSLFKLEKMEGKKIKCKVILNFADEEENEDNIEVLKIKFDSSFNDIAFGKAPKEKEKTNLAFTNDPKIENLQAIFKKVNEKFLLTTLESTEGSEFNYILTLIFFNY